MTLRECTNHFEVEEIEAIPILPSFVMARLGGEALSVPVAPAPKARLLQCFWNVRDLVEQEGGEAVYGWQISEWSGVLYQCEHHAVWRRADGVLVDPTPSEGGETHSIFIPRGDMPFTGWQIPTRRIPISTDVKVMTFCFVSDEADRLRVSVQRAPMTEHGKIYYDIQRLPFADHAKFVACHNQREDLFPYVRQIGHEWSAP